MPWLLKPPSPGSATCLCSGLRSRARQPAIRPYTPIWNYFGADEPNYLYAPNGKKLLGELAALSPVPVYFRPHNLLTTGNGEGSLKWGSTNVYTERPDGTPVYDFTITDRIFDALIAAHVRPLVEIGFMPEALSTHPEPYRHTFPKGDIFTGWTYPPKDEAKWSKLVAAYAAHLRDRYGSQTETWLWEVWNEPDIGYWHGTPERVRPPLRPDRRGHSPGSAPQRRSAAPRRPASATTPSRSFASFSNTALTA